MKKFLALLAASVFACVAYTQITIIHYLSGTGKDHTVQWDFMVTHGMNRNKWLKIDLPSCWSMLSETFENLGYSNALLFFQMAKRHLHF